MKGIRSILAILVAFLGGSNSFTAIPRRNNRGPNNRPLPRLFAKFLKQLPGESDPDYMKRLRLIASDPEAFERAVREGGSGNVDAKPQQVSGNNWSPTSLHTSAPQSSKAYANDTKSSDGDSAPKGYQRIEDWEHDQQQLLKDMTYEQRLQFEGQRDGNRFNQNEILRNSLKRW